MRHGPAYMQKEPTPTAVPLVTELPPLLNLRAFTGTSKSKFSQHPSTVTHDNKNNERRMEVKVHAKMGTTHISTTLLVPEMCGKFA